MTIICQTKIGLAAVISHPPSLFYDGGRMFMNRCGRRQYGLKQIRRRGGMVRALNYFIYQNKVASRLAPLEI